MCAFFSPSCLPGTFGKDGCELFVGGLSPTWYRLQSMKIAPLPRLLAVERTVALSDGIFAVVITILVLGIEVPDGGMISGPELTEVRVKLAHQVLIYFVCFWIVAMYWSQHGLLFLRLKRMDGVLLVLNLLFMLPVTLLPFVTEFMGERRDHSFPVVMFALTNLVSVLVLRGMWRRVMTKPDFFSEEPYTTALAERLVLGLHVFMGAMVLGVLLSFIDPRAGVACFLIPPVGHFVNYVRDSLRAESADTGGGGESN